MTKIYLVVFETKEEKIYDCEVFTNKRKAEQYKRYWNAKMKLEKSFEGDRTRLIERTIRNVDYTKFANEKEMELLPF